ncbi:4-hydroxybenzoate 3-monooxygenase [Gordonia amarae]|uniref:p-hydroxybenzoate hydroxylase n=2 Tax=Gordonia amarae TaxID=36821 RepID=G7GIS6_9ACTN|nr:4-hydroxybenzoate 3-monooxygenase [Gordonia amarae]MCS3879155.1 p-hydroxybenzoate 3-monooxygenase [Gordonia amarae]QHN17673.1 4-hydroxybenzoate 3-monooxygenase [Gordonia amarae]QHN22203.1 4-hydroxybenzoate 3-monooxygenase [Gordonia amarae]QHN31080.1 4-hydroxybenzoate 3-monooxygenase [Gordonia amarae]QHN39825.1 4-hydroxybenzoate 3-monooxygenase [Gordonia amarae]
MTSDPTLDDRVPSRTQVAIVGAGPAGLTLGHLLHLQGIGSVILERSSREHVEQRLRAGIIEQPSVDLLVSAGLGDRLLRAGMVHSGFYLRYDDSTHYLDFHPHTGQHATVYGQHELVKDLIAARIGTRRPLLFDTEVTAISPTGPTASVRYRTAAGEHTLEADFVVGADGFHGAGRAAIPAEVRGELIREYPVAWLGILAESTPAAPEGMYCPHPNGLSVHSMRGPKLSRQYLQVPAGTELGDWSDEQIWDELSLRCSAADAAPLETGPIIERSLAPLRSYVSSTMQYDRLFLAGDAAHIVPPTGAKGLNLAISDTCVLSHALGAALNHGSTEHLERYTATALPRVMAAQRFSALLTTTLHALPGDGFTEALRRATLDRWVGSQAAQHELGEVYLGLPFATAPTFGSPIGAGAPA